jgi:hypothetical protein
MGFKHTLIVLTSILAACASAKEKQQASVRVVNHLSTPIFGVTVSHKYSDVYKNNDTWGVIKPHEEGNHSMEVEYNTGFLTTGRDWWFLAWFNEDFSQFCYSHPNNFRDIIDALEGIGPDVLAAEAGALAGILAAESGPAGILAAAAGAAALSKTITSGIFNSESTVGYKQHILREEDAGGNPNDPKNSIIISDEGIRFDSPSGVSETVVACRPTKKEEREKNGQS